MNAVRSFSVRGCVITADAWEVLISALACLNKLEEVDLRVENKHSQHNGRLSCQDRRLDPVIALIRDASSLKKLHLNPQDKKLEKRLNDLATASNKELELVFGDNTKAKHSQPATTKAIKRKTPSSAETSRKPQPVEIPPKKKPKVHLQTVFNAFGGSHSTGKDLKALHNRMPRNTGHDPSPIDSKQTHSTPEPPARPSPNSQQIVSDLSSEISSASRSTPVKDERYTHPHFSGYDYVITGGSSVEQSPPDAHSNAGIRPGTVSNTPTVDDFHPVVGMFNLGALEETWPLLPEEEYAGSNDTATTVDPESTQEHDQSECSALNCPDAMHEEKGSDPAILQHPSTASAPTASSNHVSKPAYQLNGSDSDAYNSDGESSLFKEMENFL